MTSNKGDDKMNIQDKALEVIDCLVSDDLPQGLDYQLVMGRKIILSQEDLLILAKKINLIYTVAHSAVKTNRCYDFHESWRKETERLWASM